MRTPSQPVSRVWGFARTLPQADPVRTSSTEATITSPQIDTSFWGPGHQTSRITRGRAGSAMLMTRKPL
jgi:hypothetical protein